MNLSVNAPQIDPAVMQYLQSIPGSRQQRVQKIHNLILSLFPEARVDMGYKMPTYRVAKGWVALANQKKYISVYTCGYHHIEKFKTKHPRIKTGKGCINFQDRDSIPMADLKGVIRHAMLHHKPGD